ncbi:tRNA1(Val) (adenine(37)-N6)-methyltransferase [Sagittula sp. S175]|uniref:tRNA1(Val) (adenine(37)-N6)-methyltransferase n=1 Tax=Sagittula sp. S175 TaxID=3415129 RepID=UPI003C7A49E2
MRAEPFPEDELTRDAMLGGKVQLWQPREGYRAGTDPVLLAASVQARAGQSVLELGCGGGATLCCLGMRVPGLRLCGIEIQPGYADLARRNLSDNGLQGEVWEGDLTDPPRALRGESFDMVVANPPYFETGKGFAASDSGRSTGRSGEVPLSAWVAVATKRLKPRGYATFIQRIERLPELLAAMDAHLGALELLPLLPRENRPPRLFLLRGRKDGRAPFRFHPPKVIHGLAIRGNASDNYTDSFREVMVSGASLEFEPDQG